MCILKYEANVDDNDIDCQDCCDAMRTACKEGESGPQPTWGTIMRGSSEMPGLTDPACHAAPPETLFGGGSP